MSKDIYGKALLDYLNNNYTEDLVTFSTISEKDILPLPYLFRSFKEMPRLEQFALDQCKGHVLDLGAGAGSHSLYLQSKNKQVTAIDISEGAIDVCKKRGVQNALVEDIWKLKNRKFDTILALMNGAGICGKLEHLAPFLLHLKSMMHPKGQILIDSCDIIYMYEDEQGAHWIPSNIPYYGEVEFNISYKKEKATSFSWLYVDFNTLQRCANDNGFFCELIHEGEYYDYLVKLTLI